MDKDFCRQQARLVRSLADQADPFIKRRLLQLAEHYERRLSISRISDQQARDSEQKERGNGLAAENQSASEVRPNYEPE
jgi:hypothetical protein